MKNTTLFLLALIALTSLSLRSAAQTMSDTDEIKDYSEESMITEYLIIAGTSSDYFAMKNFAMDLSKKTGIKYDDEERVYKDQCIALSDTSSDELYRSVYIFRRWDFESISIELNIDGIHFDPSESKERPRMIIVAGMAGSWKDAAEKLRVIRKFVPTAYIKKKQVYMGCIH